MTKHIINRVLSVFLALILVISAIPFSAPTANAVTQEEINALREQLKELETQAQAQQEVINELAERKARVVDRKIAMDARIDLTRRQIQVIQSTIDAYDQIVAEKEAEFNEAQNVEDTQAELLRARIRAMEESGNASIIAFLFESDSLTDLLSRLADVDDIMHYDQTLEADYRAARENVEAIKKGYEEARQEQEQLRGELDRRTEELNAQIEAACRLIADISLLSDDAQAEYDAIDAVRAETDAEINALLKKLAEEEEARRRAEEEARRRAEEERRRLEEQQQQPQQPQQPQSSAVSLTSLIWPVPSCSIITSRFGPRSSPTAGASSYHGGLDIGAAEGAAIVAAESGSVILAGANGGYGNCVMINHGNGIVTLYGHMMSVAVGYGQEVVQGQVIGYVGSTGISTGPHCHFEIRVNGAATDPAPYFSGLTYYC